MNKRTLVLWAVSLVAAYTAGVVFPFPDRHNISPAESGAELHFAGSPAAQSANDSVVAFDILSVDNEQLTLKGESSADNLNVQALVDRLQQVLASEDGEQANYGQLGEAFNAISQLNETQLLEALLRFEPLAGTRENRALLEMLLVRYSKFNPQEAMAYLHRNVENPLFRLSPAVEIMSDWSEQDSQSAYDWFVKNKEAYSRYGGRLVSSLFKGLATQDRYDAMDKLDSLTLSRNEIGRAVHGITSNLSEGHEYIELIDVARLQDRKEVTRHILAEWTREDPHSASHWLTASTLNSERLQQTVMLNWMRGNQTDRAEAADWYIHQTTLADYQQRINEVMEAFAFNDPEAGINWLDKSDISDRDSALKTMIGRSVFQHPDFAISQIAQIQDEAKRLEASKAVYRGLTMNNPDKAEDFAANSPYKETLLKIRNPFEPRR
ncbi:hypothetical protein [Lacimicrobium alkaliphilum]|uniref:Uncharacterized protein n=1 Tax=Lacimicrobium alkaliphilum TaxID=1526571 RepID=A0A0U2PJ84_9ALTE|nr:hypothetical protein [Lacimicrobium alkaliphilum]ALS99597.1 hypothetical protein AT746_15910 [Lacimicrobium alkaliphilum]